MAYLQKIYMRQIRKDGLSHMLHLQQHERPTQNTFKLAERERERPNLEMWLNIRKGDVCTERIEGGPAGGL